MKKTLPTPDHTHHQLTSPLQATAQNGWLLAIRLTPNASREEFKGIFEDSQGRLYLRATVRTVPEDGLANKALLKLISKQWGISKDSLTLQSGATYRLKIFRIKAITLALEQFIDNEVRMYTSR